MNPECGVVYNTTGLNFWKQNKTKQKGVAVLFYLRD